MSEKEKDILKRLSSKLPKLDRNEQSYILGVAEGMAIAKESGETEKEKEVRNEKGT